MGKKTIKCCSCEMNITKTQSSLQCIECEHWFHKSCTKLTNKEYDAFSDKKSKQRWTCFICKQDSSSESPSSDEETSDKEKNIVKRNRKSSNHNPSNHEMLEIIMTKFEKLEESVQFTTNIMDDMKKSLQDIVSENIKLKKEQQSLKNKMKELEGRLVHVENNIEREEIDKRKCNIVIVGLKDKQSLQENVKKVFQKLDPEIKSDGYSILTVPKKSPSSPVIVRFNKLQIVERMMELRKRKKTLTTIECGIDGESRNIYFNEDLPKATRDLYKKARELKGKNYKYVWCKNGQIFVRKDEGDEAVKINSVEQIKILIDNY